MSEILKGKSLLIVDDERDLRWPLRIEFESLGCKVFEASNGQEALKIIQSESIDGVISDIRMPGGDGIQLLKDIKESDHEFPVVLLITGFMDISVEDAYHYGAEEILAKPFDLDEIEAAVVKILTPRAVRWSAPPDSNIKERIEASFAGVDKASLEGSVAIGRGGIFLRLPSFGASVGHKVAFHIRFDQGDILLIEGTGTVRWSHTKTENESFETSGIEFESLSEETRQKVLAITNLLKTKPYIPKSI